MTRTIGGVNFTARIDGRRTPRDAERIGQQAGKAGADGFDEEWSKGFRETLDKNGRAAFDRWKANGKKDGGIYGGTFSRTFTPYIKKAQATFDQLTVNPKFLDGLRDKFKDAGLAAGDVQRQLIDLNREGLLSDQVFAGARKKVDEWAKAQRDSIIDINRNAAAVDAQRKSVDNLRIDIDRQADAYRQRILESEALQKKSTSNLREWLDQQREAYQRVSKAAVEHSKALDVEQQNRYTESVKRARQSLLDNVEVHTRSADALRSHIKEVGSADLAYRDFARHLDEYRLSVGGTDRTYIAIASNIDRVRGAVDKATESMRRNRVAVDSMNGGWSSIPHNGRQAILIVSAVAAGMQQIAVLGSAAGAGLLVLGATAAGAVVGIGGLVAAFVRLAGDAEKVPDAIKPAAEAFRKLKEPLNELMDALAVRAFAGTERAFASMGDTIRKLTPAFEPLGDAINRIVNGFADWSASEEGIRLLSSLIRNSAPIFERLVGIVGRAGEALLIAFDNPYMQKAIGDMLTGIEGLFDTFVEFVSSDDFGEWIENTSSVMGKLGELIGATSQMFDDLITPEAYQRMEDFIQDLTDFMPHLGDFLDILGRLDIFGIIADVLVELGEILEPLAIPMKEFADGLSRVVEIAIDEWGDKLKPVADALVPFVEAMADFLNDVPPGTVRAIADALLLMGGAIVAMSLIKWVGLATGLTGFFTSLRAGDGIVKSFSTSKLAGIARGLGAFALIGAAQLIPKSFWEQFNIESNLPSNVLTGAGIGLMFGAWGAVIGAGIGYVVSLFTDFEGTMNDTGLNLLAVFSTGPMGALGALIGEFFANLIPAEWATSDNPLQQFVAGLAFIATDTGTAITIILEQLGRWWEGLVGDATTAVSDFLNVWSGFWANAGNPEFWEGIGTKVVAWLAMMVASFQARLGEIGVNWGIFWGNLPTIVDATFKKSVAFVTAMFVAIKVQFQSGLNGALGQWNAFWGGLPNAVQGAVNRITGLVSTLMAAVQRALGGVGSLGKAASAPLNVPQMASGGVLGGPRVVLAGEAGREAIVPLERDLSRVDPSVRWLSAIAQGKSSVPQMASGGIVGGPNVTIEAGAIVVSGAGDPEAVALAVMNAVAELVGS